MADDDPYLWSSDHVRSQICSPDSSLHATLRIKPILNLELLGKSLHDNDIDGESLLALEDTNVKDDLGIASFGQRREIRKIIQHLRSISSHRQITPENHNKRRLSIQDEEQGTTPESKRQRTFSLQHLENHVTSHISSSVMHDLDSSINLPQSHASTSTEQIKRRIQPQNLSTEPITGSKLITSDPLADFQLRPLSTVPTVDTFNPNELSDEWRDFLERHAEDSDDTILRPYNESDSEKELDSEEDASLLEELIQPQDVSRKPRISAGEIEGVIDEELQAYERSWVTFKQPKKSKTAYRRWMQAAKAGTRKPQQNALRKQLDALESRLSRFRRSIADTSMEYQKVDEVKRNCLNLQATVEDIAEKKYYLQALNSNEPPEQVVHHVQIPTPEEALSADEELLESSESAQDSSENELASDDADLTSENDSGLSLPYDPADHEWNPRIPMPPTTDSSSPFEPPAGSDMHPANAIHDEVMDLEEPLAQPNTYDTEGDVHSESSARMSISPSPLARRDIGPRLRQEFEDTQHNHVPKESTSSDDGEDSDLDRLPRNRYRHQGKTWDTAISLGSSPSRSDDQSILTDHSITTPPLNPVALLGTQSEKSPRFDWPSIKELRSRKYKECGEDPKLLLCKTVYHLNRSIAQEVQEFISRLSVNTIIQRLRAGIANIQDTAEENYPPPDAYPDTLDALTCLFIVYACAKPVKDIWDVPDADLDPAFNMIPDKAEPFVKLLRPLLKFYVETPTEIAKDSTAIHDVAHQIHNPTDRNGAARLGGVHGSKKADRGRPNTPPPLNLNTDTETDDEPSTQKKRKHYVQQSQEAISQQRNDQLRVQEQERRRQLMMTRFRLDEGSGETRRVIVNSVEDVPILLDEHIARRIKPHQETGVQFIWRELIEDAKKQGCLLAHTMGLGKTMQVISFLVTLAQCNASERKEVRDLIPRSLRSGRILILCPASLVDNWHDELSMWVPPGSESLDEPGLLGNIYAIAGTREFKIRTIRKWRKRAPGVLIIGYESLRSLLTSPSIHEDEKRYLEKALLRDPCVVIGDEAHKLKNAKSEISKLAKQFTTTSRIALTGSPLNNHLEEYHTMIDWIAPGYLGTLVQFKSKYSEPIERGLVIESTRYEKRKSLERLYVLKRDLAPKIDRKDISAIAKDMPQKTEFFITVPLTGLQKALYTLLVRQISSNLNPNGGSSKPSNAQLWSWLSILSWLCNHPTILTKKLESDETNTSAVFGADDAGNDGAPANVDIKAYPLADLLPRFSEKYAEFNAGEDMFDPALSTRTMVTKLLVQESLRKGERILIFSHSIPTLNYLQNMLHDMQCKFLRIDGQVRADQRQAATKEFNDGHNEYMVFLISTRAGGLGLNLQGANRVIIYDFGFNPSWEEQAIGRAYRLGQKRPVFVYRFRAGGTYEDVQYNKSIFKTQLFSRVVDQKNVVRQTSRDIKAYLFEPTEPEQMDLSESLGKDELLDKVIEMAPGSIRDLILTETFQREDEDDELTAEEKKMADEQVELERLQRSDPEAYRAKMVTLQQSRTQTPMAPTLQAQNLVSAGPITGATIHGWYTDLPHVEGSVRRDAMQANQEKMGGVPSSTSNDSGNVSGSDGAEAEVQNPGCEAQ